MAIILVSPYVQYFFYMFEELDFELVSNSFGPPKAWKLSSLRHEKRS